MPPWAVRNKIRDGSLMKRGLIEERGKGGSEACCCLIQWDAPGAWRLAHFNCTRLSFIKGSMRRYSFNESEREGRLFSFCLSHTLKDNVIVLVRPTCFGEALLQHNCQLHTQTRTHTWMIISIWEENRRGANRWNKDRNKKKKEYWKKGNSIIRFVLSTIFSGIWSIISSWP